MATSLMLDRIARQFAAAMALVIMMASLPSIGVIVISDRSGPTISMDICHPLQSLESSPSFVLVARPASPKTGAKILPHEVLAQLVPILKSRFVEAPDPPPPKLFC
jgi:hypothetical protein